MFCISTHFCLKSSVATPVQAVPGETVETDAGAVSAICGVGAMDSTHYCGVRADGVRNESLQRSQTPYCDQRHKEQDSDCLASPSRHGASRGLPYTDIADSQPAGSPVSLVARWNFRYFRR